MAREMPEDESILFLGSTGNHLHDNTMSQPKRLQYENTLHSQHHISKLYWQTTLQISHMEAKYYSEIFISTDKSTRCHSPEDYNVNTYRHQDLKYYISKYYWQATLHINLAFVGRMLFRNPGTNPQDYTISHPGRQQCEKYRWWKHQILYSGFHSRCKVSRPIGWYKFGYIYIKRRHAFRTSCHEVAWYFVPTSFQARRYKVGIWIKKTLKSTA
jgi:hypothetical protein